MNIACYVRNETVFKQVLAVLADGGFESERFSSEPLLLRAVRRRDFDLILVDLAGETQDSEGIFSWLECRVGQSTPVLILSSIHTGDFAARALNAGADDVLVRPFYPVELLARIHALLRRSNRSQVRRSIDLNGFFLDREASTFSYNRIPIELTPREFTMAWLFFSSPGVYISRETIGTAIWGTDSDIAGRTIEQHVYKLRKKLQVCAQGSIIIRTAYSQGYRLELCAGEAALAA